MASTTQRDRTRGSGCRLSALALALTVFHGALHGACEGNDCLVACFFSAHTSDVTGDVSRSCVLLLCMQKPVARGFGPAATPAVTPALDVLLECVPIPSPNTKPDPLNRLTHRQQRRHPDKDLQQEQDRRRADPAWCCIIPQPAPGSPRCHGAVLEKQNRCCETELLLYFVAYGDMQLASGRGPPALRAAALSLLQSQQLGTSLVTRV